MLEQVIYGAKMYESVTGINCAVLDKDANIIFEVNSSCHEYCNLVKEKFGIGLNCLSINKNSINEALRFGGKFVYFCPMGFTYWISVIMENGVVKYSLLSGPVLMVDIDEYISYELLNKLNFSKENIEEFKPFLEKIVITNPQRVQYLSEMLNILSRQLSRGQKTTRYFENETVLNQQFDISEYMKRYYSQNYEKMPYSLEKENELITLVHEGNKKDAKKILNEILAHIFISSEKDLIRIRVRMIELVILISRAALAGGGNIHEIFNMNNDYLQQINKIEKLELLSLLGSEIVEQFTSQVFDASKIQHTDVIYRSIQYIKNNYMNKITLEDISSYVNLSSSYFGKLFNQEIKKGFSEYLSEVRIEKSKVLLKRYDLTLADIAQLVGFEDQSYFSKVFKKKIGISPKKYRENLML